MKPLSLSTPHVIVTVGIPGAGKSFFAEHFSTTFKAPLVSGTTLKTRLFGNDELSLDQETILKHALTYTYEELLRTGHTIIYDGPTYSRIDRQDIIKKAHKAGYKTLLLWVQTDSVEAKRRAINKRADHPISAATFDHMIRRFTVPSSVEKPIVVSGKHTYTSQLRIVLKHLASVRPNDKPTTANGRQILIR